MKPSLSTKKKPAASLFFHTETDVDYFINSGAETLNCVLGQGWPGGRMVNIVGDKSTDKTGLAVEALVNFQRQYPDGLKRYNETEAAFDDHYAEVLGLDTPKVERHESDTVEDMFNDLTEFTKRCEDKGKKGLYIVDSLDALSDRAEMQRGIEEGSYGASKPKQMGQLFRRLIKPLERSGVTFIIISQVRDAIGVTFGNKQTRSGGRALDFYATIILWLTHMGQIKKTVNKIERVIGVKIKAKTSKNKVAPPFRECQFDVLFSYGIDDIGSGLMFLKDADGLDMLELSTEKAVSGFRKTFNESDNADQAEMRDMLNSAVRKTWQRIEKSFTPIRGKYT
jgi:recombination protein RecA